MSLTKKEYEGYGFGYGYKPKPRKAKCVLFHHHPSENWKEQTKEIRIVLHEGQYFPERHNAYGYQLAEGIYTAPKYPDPAQWEIDADSIGPMTYYGVEKVIDGLKYCEDQQGKLHLLEDGDSVIHTPKGKIEVVHTPLPDDPSYGPNMKGW